jgi:hypothetical protein
LRPRPWFSPHDTSESSIGADAEKDKVQLSVNERGGTIPKSTSVNSWFF